MLAGRFALPSWRKDVQTVALRGSKSRNKVSVGEPAEGSLKVLVASQLKCLNNSGVVFPFTRKFEPWTRGLSALGRASCLPARDWFGRGTWRMAACEPTGAVVGSKSLTGEAGFCAPFFPFPGLKASTMKIVFLHNFHSLRMKT